jgi:pimeloyl-ACP methyl ester carboxylesterase
MEGLAPTHRVLAPDSYGSGKSPDWASDRVISLDDEVDLIEPVLAEAGRPLVLVGHSYGAAVALMAALRQPGRVKALVLYEPTLFALALRQQPVPEGLGGIGAAVDAAGAAVDAGDLDTAARHFIDYWMGPGAWAHTPAERKPSIAASVRNVRRWGHALTTEPTPASAFAALDMPVLYLLGSTSPASAHAVAAQLLPVLPKVQRLEFEGLGHMAPVTHPERVNAEILRFIAGLDQR